MKTICATCGGTVWTERLIEHWRDYCPGSSPPLLDTAWDQINEIVVATGFDQRDTPTIDPRDGGRNDR